MIVLEKFKNIAEDDKKNLPIYCIYNDIYNSAKSNNFDISDADAMTIQEKSYDLYINDDYGHMPASKIAYFLTDCYSKDDLFLNKIEDRIRFLRL